MENNNRYTIVDQELKNYLDNHTDNLTEQSNAILDILMDRYNLTTDNTDGFFDSALHNIWVAQLEADNVFQAHTENWKEVVIDNIKYTYSDVLDKEIGDEVYSPYADAIFILDEEHWGDEEDFCLVVKKEPIPIQEFEVKIGRVIRESKTCKVKAHSQEEAEELALKQSDNDEGFTFDSALYKVKN